MDNERDEGLQIFAEEAEDYKFLPKKLKIYYNKRKRRYLF